VLCTRRRYFNFLDVSFYPFLQCQVAAWSLHKPECQKKKKSSKASASGEKKQKGSTRTDKVSAKMKRDEAKETVVDLKNAHATYGHDKEEDK